MSVILNETALTAFLQSPQGPVGQDLQQRTLEVVELARRNVRFIMARAGGDVAQDIDFELGNDGEGLFAVVGIRDGGRQARYLAAKEAREEVWLVPALTEAVI